MRNEQERLAGLLPHYLAQLPRYTSYPTAPMWNDGFGPDDFRRQLAGVTDDVSVYVHVPFCESLCHFCACNRIVKPPAQAPTSYLDTLALEIEHVRRELPSGIGAAQVHLGGGTPTYLDPQQLRRLVAAISGSFPIRRDAELSIEVDPRVTTPEHVAAISECGFKRVSLGVQDFDTRVQEAIHRIQSVDMTRKLVSDFRSSGVVSVSFDLIYGLPFQTLESLGKTLDEVIAIAPDRIALYSYAHVTWIAKQQRGFDRLDLPSPKEKLELFQLALQRLMSAGYEYLGLDHFALPGDDLARSLRRGTLHRNFMGYTAHAGHDLVGFGPSAISELSAAYAQNERELGAWQSAIEGDGLATMRGCELSEDDLERRFAISRLLCRGEVDASEFTARFGRRFSNRFSDELARLGPLEQDGLLQIAADGSVKLTLLGRVLARNVASTFDAYLKRDDDEASPRFSQSI